MVSTNRAEVQIHGVIGFLSYRIINDLDFGPVDFQLQRLLIIEQKLQIFSTEVAEKISRIRAQRDFLRSRLSL